MLLPLVCFAATLSQSPPLEGEVAFMRHGTVSLVNIANGRVEELAQTEFDRPLSWSPDATRILYWNHNAGWNIWEVEVASGDVRNLSDQIGWDCRSPSFSPDGHRIAFVAGARGLCVMGSGGSGVRVLHKTAHRDAQPQWSADGSSLLFQDLSKGKSMLMVMPSNGGELTSLGEGDEAAGAPHANVVAFVFGGDIYIASFDGSMRRQLTQTADWVETQPQWSRDGKWIAFRRKNPNGEELCLMRADGTDVKSLTPIRGDGLHRHTFDTRGQWIAYSGGSKDAEILYVISVEGGQPKELTDGGALWPAARPRFQNQP